MSDELKPCPFCGGPGYLWRIPSAADGEGYIWIAKCSAEKGCGVEFLGTSRKVDAIKEWNTLVDPSPKWTYCEDALPNEDGLYLVTLDSESVLIDRWATVEGNWWQFSNSRVIAWQPLPAPAEPKEAK